MAFVLVIAIQRLNEGEHFEYSLIGREKMSAKRERIKLGQSK